MPGFESNLIDLARARRLGLGGPSGTSATVWFITPVPISDRQAAALRALNDGDRA
ncbi:MAG: hypothetical protein U0Y82_16960 [Thermoleophilia bacterium]